MSTDDKFGRPITAKEVSDAERSCLPTSLQRLDRASAASLTKYMQTAVDGLKIPQVNHQCLIVLWVIDEHDRIWFSLEEAVDEASHSLLYPLPRVWDLPDGHVKLGHPSLTTNGVARIGGEIIYDPEFGANGWVISNKSGRYGFGEHRTREHLENAAAEWRSFGIELDMHYIDAR